MKKLIFVLFALSISLFQSGYAEKQAMTPETLWEFGRVGGMQVSPDGNTLLFTVTHYDIDKNEGRSDIYTIPVEGGEPKNITGSEHSEFNVLWRPDGEKIGYLSAKNGTVQLWEINPDGSDPVQVSDIPDGITRFEYSPGVNHIYFTKQVKLEKTPQEMHPDLDKANVLIYDDLMYRHWNEWHDYSYSHIFIAPYSDGELGDHHDIMEDEPWDTPLPPFGGISQISWTPDGSQLAYTCKKKKGKEWTLSTNSDIYLYDLETGETENLTTFNEGYDRNPVFSPDGNYMAWESLETPGFESDKSRIMMMDLNNGNYEDYSEGFDRSSRNFRWSDDGQSLYFISGINATYQMYSLDIASKEITRLTDGRHNYNSLELAGDHLVGERMSMSSPVEIFRVSLEDHSQERVTFVNESLLDETKMGEVEERWVETTDGKEMLVWVIYPPDFDPDKEYPALLYCGGGPQVAVSQSFSYRWNFQMMAANDYIIIAPNRRGLPTFGREWNDQISEDYGGQNMQDYLSAVSAVKTEPFVDESRIGAVGASYGGYSVLWLAGNHDGLFSAFISHCGLYNFESWYGSTEEMFFANHDIGGPYWEDPTPHSYEFSPHNYVQNWDTPIMVIQGAKDYRVPKSEGFQAFNAAQLQDVPSRLMFFPEENHWVLQPQNGIVWQREFFKWLDKWLK